MLMFNCPGGGCGGPGGGFNVSVKNRRLLKFERTTTL